MTLHEFEKELRENVHDGIRIIPHPTNEDMAGVYIQGIKQSVCGIPSGHIYHEKKESYKSKYGVKHATIPETYAKIEKFYLRLKNEEGFAKLMNMDMEK